MPGRTKTRAINYKEVDSVSESSESSSAEEEDQDLKARLEASGAPLLKRKRTKKEKKSSDKSRKRHRQDGSPHTAAEPATDSVAADEDDTPLSGVEARDGGAGENGGDDAQALQAANLFEKLPCELLGEIFSYLDLKDLIQLARTTPSLNAMLLAPSAQSIWSKSRRNAGYVLFPGMSEINFALTMEGSLCQYCFAAGDLEMRWMARLCKDCKQRRAGCFQGQASSHSRGWHKQLLSCIQPVSVSSNKEYILEELETVNTDLHEAQTAGRAKKAARTSAAARVERYVTERKRLLADRDEARKVNRAAQATLRLTLASELLARRRIGVCAREGRTVEILQGLRDRHDWTTWELAGLEVHLWREPHDSAFARGMPELPPMLPHHAPLAWELFRAKPFAHDKASGFYDYHRDKMTRMRAELVQSWYVGYTPILADELCISVDDLPVWDRMQKTPEIRTLCWTPLTFLRAKPPTEYQEIFERTARATMEHDRITAIRYALAAQLDIYATELSCDPADYPASEYNKLFLDRLINRFEIGRSKYLTYREALRSGYTAETVSQITRTAWRRAIAHVLRAAKIEDTECSLDKLDALGAAFRWTNGPPAYNSHNYDWRTMVDLLVQHGPMGLHLADLHNVQLVYNRAKVVAKQDKKASRLARNLAAAEEKTATSLSPDRHETNDTTTGDSALNSLTSNGSRGRAAAGPTAPATATTAATLRGLRRSNRLAPPK